MDKEESDSIYTFDPNTFKVFEKASVEYYEKQAGELDFSEASKLLGVLVMAITQSENVQVADEGRVVVDYVLDGKEATENYGIQKARELAPRIDDERTLIINVVRNKTFWETIRNREPKVIHTLHYHDEPVQYS